MDYSFESDRINFRYQKRQISLQKTANGWQSGLLQKNRCAWFSVCSTHKEAIRIAIAFIKVSAAIEMVRGFLQEAHSSGNISFEEHGYLLRSLSSRPATDPTWLDIVDYPDS